VFRANGDTKQAVATLLNLKGILPALDMNLMATFKLPVDISNMGGKLKKAKELNNNQLLIVEELSEKFEFSRAVSNDNIHGLDGGEHFGEHNSGLVP